MDRPRPQNAWLQPIAYNPLSHQDMVSTGYGFWAASPCNPEVSEVVLPCLGPHRKASRANPVGGPSRDRIGRDLMMPRLYSVKLLSLLAFFGKRHLSL